MNKFHGMVSALGLAAIMIFAQGKPAAAEVIVNNVLSPFTAIQVGPGYRGYGPSAWWVHDARSHQRCYRRWDAYDGWRMHCVRMGYGHEPYYGHRPHYGYRSYEYGPFYEPYYGRYYRHGPQ